MTKLNKILVVLLVAQVSVLVAGKLIAMRQQEAGRPQRVLPQLVADAVTALKIIDNQGRTAVLEKQDEVWRLASGGGYPTAQNKVSDLLAKLSGVVSSRLVATKQTHHRSLEVSEENFQRDVTITTPQQTYRFLLGTSPGLKQVHLRHFAEDLVYAVQDLSAWDLGTAPTSWVDSAYLKVEKKDLVSVTLTNRAGTIQLDKDGDGAWTMLNKPTGKALDSTAIESFLSSATSISLQEPVAKTVAPETGLAQPQARLMLVTETRPAPAQDAASPETPPAATAEADAAVADQAAAEPPAPPLVRTSTTIAIGAKKEEKDGPRFYAKSDQSEFVVLVGAWVAEPLIEKVPEDFFEKPEKAPAENMPPMGMPPMGQMGLPDNDY